jgi:hypothetical protein
MNRFAMVVVLLLLSIETARAACNDPAAVASTRAAADVQCPCATAASLNPPELIDTARYPAKV